MSRVYAANNRRDSGSFGVFGINISPNDKSRIVIRNDCAVMHRIVSSNHDESAELIISI